MVQSVARDAKLYPHEQDTLYDARLIKVEQLDFQGVYKQGPKIGQPRVTSKWEWSFEITSGQHAGDVVKGSTEPELNMLLQQAGLFPPCRPWVESLTGKEVFIGQPFDSDSVIGLPCRITVKHEEPQPRKNGDGFWYRETVLDVLPPAGSAAAFSSEPPF
jgi:hypothetical protein